MIFIRELNYHLTLICNITYSHVFFYSFFTFTFSYNVCLEHNRDQCYHWNVSDVHSLEIFQQLLEQHLQQQVSNSGWHYEEVKHGTRILCDPNDLTRESNSYNIDLIPSDTTDQERCESRLFQQSTVN